MPFGLSNAPAIFQELMSVVLARFGHFAMAYLDDILIFSPTFEDQDKMQLPEFSEIMKNKVNMSHEQGLNNEISTIMKSLQNGNTNNKTLKHYIIIDDILYYISDIEDDPCLRLFVPNKFRGIVVKEDHDLNGHMGIQKTFDAIRQKYYWPTLFKQIHQYVVNCHVCQTRLLLKVKQPLQEIDFPLYAMAKLSLDLSGPYPTTMSGNKYT